MIESKPTSTDSPLHLHRTALPNVMEELKGKVIVVGGAYGALGKVTCEVLSGYGAIVEPVGLMRQSAFSPLDYQSGVDLSNSEGTAQFFNDLRNKHQQIDGYVSCVWGGPQGKNLLTVTDDEVAYAFRNTFNSVLFPVQEATRWMKATSGGNVVIISSVNADLALDEGPYDWAKAALRSLTQDLLSGAKEGIVGVNLSIGTLGDTPSWVGIDEQLRDVANQSPDGKVSTPIVVAHATAVMLTSLGSLFNGHTLPADRGWALTKRFKDSF